METRPHDSHQPSLAASQIVHGAPPPVTAPEVVSPFMRAGDDALHAKKRAEMCSSKCARCHFVAGMDGRLRKSKFGFSYPCVDFAWRDRFKFLHPMTGFYPTWLAERPAAWGGAWGIGCWLCNALLSSTSGAFARFEIKEFEMMSTSSFTNHAQRACHKRALWLLPTLGPKHIKDCDFPTAPFSGASDDVPRLDRWIWAGEVVERHHSIADYTSRAMNCSASSCLLQGGAMQDCSPQCCKQMVCSMAEPLRWRDHEVMLRALRVGITLDERAQIVLVLGRFYIGQGQLYVGLLGILRDYGTGLDACRKL
jgi:hypothetical protein